MPETFERDLLYEAAWDVEPDAEYTDEGGLCECDDCQQYPADETTLHDRPRRTVRVRRTYDLDNERSTTTPEPRNFPTAIRVDSYTVNAHLARVPEDERLTFRFAYPGYAEYGQWLRSAFGFFRRHGGGRYTDATLMQLVRAADKYEGALRNGAEFDAVHEDTDLPVLVVADRPYSYDEDTEVKTGGMVGLAVCWPERQGKTLVAVQADYRRKHIGSLLLTQVRSLVRDASLWVGQQNVIGQKFLLANNLVPVGFSSGMAIRYGTMYETEEVA